MAKTLLEVFNLNGKARKRTGGGTPRAKGTKAEILLLAQLTQQGYEVRRTHLSLFPDIIAWTATDLLLIEVKSRSNNPRAISQALSLFRTGVRAMTSVPNGATTQIEPIVSEGTS